VLYAVTNRNVYSKIGTLFGGFVDVIRISITSVLLFAIAGYANQDMIVELPGGATMDLAYIEPGTFMMGSLSSEWKHQASERPQHEVTISVASLTSILRQISTTGKPLSACRKAKAICSSVKRFPFMVGRLPNLKIARFYSQSNWYSFRGRDHSERDLIIGPVRV